MSQHTNLIIFVNGFTHGCSPFREYWMKNSAKTAEEKNEFVNAANNYFKEENQTLANLFIDGSCRQRSIFNYIGFTSASKRFKLGKKFSKVWLEKMQSTAAESKKIDVQKCTLNFVTHSLGGAYGEGMISFLLENNLKVNKAIHLSTADAFYIKVVNSSEKVTRIQLGVDRDWTIKRYADPFTRGEKLIIPTVDFYAEIIADHQLMIPNVSPKDQIKYNYHAWTKWDLKVFEAIKTLETIQSKELKPKDNSVTKNEYQFRFVKVG